MTPDDLAAIRARDAAFAGADDFTPLTGWDSAQMRAYDRRALLAEVDRLRGDNAVLSDAMVDRNIDRWDRGVAAERARIRAAVEGLAKGPNPSRSRLLDPGAVLAVIEGGSDDPA